jgi:hypothetical protein
MLVIAHLITRRKILICENLGLRNGVFEALWDVMLRDIMEEEKAQHFDHSVTKYLLNVVVCKAGQELDYHDRLSVVFFSPFKQLIRRT